MQLLTMSNKSFNRKLLELFLRFKTHFVKQPAITVYSVTFQPISVTSFSSFLVCGKLSGFLMSGVSLFLF